MRDHRVCYEKTRLRPFESIWEYAKRVLDSWSRDLASRADNSMGQTLSWIEFTMHGDAWDSSMPRFRYSKLSRLVAPPVWTHARQDLWTVEIP